MAGRALGKRNDDGMCVRSLAPSFLCRRATRLRAVAGLSPRDAPISTLVCPCTSNFKTSRSRGVSPGMFVRGNSSSCARSRPARNSTSASVNGLASIRPAYTTPTVSFAMISATAATASKRGPVPRSPNQKSPRCPRGISGGYRGRRGPLHELALAVAVQRDAAR